MNIQVSYYNYLRNMIWSPTFGPNFHYDKLLMHLMIVPFRVVIYMDQNRVKDGYSLRQYYIRDSWSYEYDTQELLDSEVSVLEVLIALAYRWENQFMSDPDIGDRTNVWFWEMISNLGLGVFNDEHFDPDAVDYILDQFMDHTYEYDGTGGNVFIIENPDMDLRSVELWNQMCWYFDERIY